MGKRCAGCDNISRFEVLIDRTSMTTSEGVALAIKHLERMRAKHGPECKRQTLNGRRIIRSRVSVTAMRLNRYRPRHLAVKR